LSHLGSLVPPLYLHRMDTTKELRLAVLIDADNIPSSGVKGMLEEVAKYGTPTFKRIYADWTKPHVSGWKSVLLENAITPIQQYSYTQGKNSSDSALIIDAMDILYSGRVDGFCIVSSDSDFTRLATRLREAGMKVLGIGEKKTPVPFITACDKFIYLEILKKNAVASRQTAPSGRPKKTDLRRSPSPAPALSPAAGQSPEIPAVEHVAPEPVAQEPVSKVDKELIKLISDSVNDLADEAGWTFLGALGTLLLKKQPDFDPRNYGFSKLVSLIKSIPDFELDHRKSAKSNSVHVYVREK
jgi:Fe-S-cluster formation regulator IscX/YfhJ